MQYLYDMASKGFIDAKIVENIDGVMARYSLRTVPSPFDDSTDKGDSQPGSKN
jgi:hypothetical protein